MAEEEKKKKTVKKNFSAIKKDRQDKMKCSRNAAYLSKVKTAIKKCQAESSNKDTQIKKDLLDDAYSLLDKAAKKGLLKTNSASRKKSALARLLATSK